MRSHQQIIKDAGGPTSLAKAISADPNTAKAWGRSNSIPAPYWSAVALANLATLEELAIAAAARRAA